MAGMVRVRPILAALLIAGLALSEGAGAEENADILLAQAQVRTFDLPAQPLTSAVTAFGDQAGLQITVDTRILAGHTSKPVKGSLTRDEALAQMLAGSGITWRYTDPDTVLLLKMEAGNIVPLAPVPVEDTRLGGPSWAPVEGYVAEQSGAGTKTDTPLIETPQSISVVTADQMEAQGAESVTDALRYTSGVQVQPFGRDGRFDWISIRGYDSSEFLYRDGIGTPTGQMKLEPYGLERLEILKGPASVTYGQMAPGGVVNAVTKRPTEEPLHVVELMGGSYEHIEGRFDFGGPLGGDQRFLYRLTGLARDSGSQVDHTPDNRYYIAPAFTWNPNEDTSLTLLTDFRYDETRYPQGFPVSGTLTSNSHGPIPTNTFLGEPDQDKFNRNQYSAAVLFSRRIDDVFSFHQDFRYSHYDYDLVAHNAIGYQAGSDRVVDRIIWTARPNFNATATDTRGEADFDTGPFGHKVLLGANWMRSELEDQGTITMGTPIDVYDPDYGNFGSLPDDTDHTVDTLWQVGIYLQDQITFDERWIAALSIRQDWARNGTRNLVASDGTSQYSDDLTWRAGLVYKSPIGLAPYFSYATSFDPAIGTTFDGAPFKPTTSQQYEVGVKFQPEGYNSFITVSAFDLTQQNVLTTDPDPTHPGESVQTGETRTRGIEFEAVASLDMGLDLIGSYTYLDAKITKSEDGDEGFRVKSIPHHQASLWADYTLRSGDFKGLGLGFGVRYLGSTLDNTNTLKTPDYLLFDASLHYELGGISPMLEGAKLSVNARNLGDKRTIASCAWDTCYFGDRRTVLATLSYRW
ncbi:TonB-dependent siderophore receptor [Dongia sedimenti]|uniref:TonB-dependent siderophore receptor n=1 Tax=Dongia sedimenti TaxID=3064282 RepID=A0ABU0YJI6_9PROT|nr:TonB-dependent siderophore receptor [Rhodospirillaceae bacterium R-7]